ncbi:MAG: hypothetical protein RL057_837 [Actinomycetota bacterium]
MRLVVERIEGIKTFTTSAVYGVSLKGITLINSAKNSLNQELERKLDKGKNSESSTQALDEDLSTQALDEDLSTQTRDEDFSTQPLVKSRNQSSISQDSAIHRIIDSARRDSERGDVPGWVLVVLMTTGLVTAIWTIAAPRLSAILKNSLDAMNGIR